MINSISRKRKKQKERLGVFLIALVFVIIVTLAFVYYRLEKTRVVIDKQTLCPKVGSVEVVVVLIDRTDPINTMQRAAILTRLDNVKQQIPKHGSIELYTISPITDQLLRPEIRMCNPGRGAEISPYLGNPRRVEARWKKSFSESLDQSFQEIVVPHAEQSSPIMESLQSVALSAFSGTAREGVPKLIIVSDMLQHTSPFSQYSRPITFEGFKQTEYYRKVRPNLHNVEVNILYLRRSTEHNVQGRKHIEFWQQFISDSGGVLTKVVQVEG